MRSASKIVVCVIVLVLAPSLGVDPRHAPVTIEQVDHCEWEAAQAEHDKWITGLEHEFAKQCWSRGGVPDFEKFEGNGETNPYDFECYGAKVFR